MDYLKGKKAKTYKLITEDFEKEVEGFYVSFGDNHVSILDEVHSVVFACNSKLFRTIEMVEDE